MASGFKIHSLGIVVEDKPQGSDYILVTPIEELNIQEEGKIKDKSTDFEGSQKEIESVNFKTEHQSKNYVRAKWRSISEGNRSTAPDVYANETVLLFKFGDVDEYYWTDFGREPELRKKEDVTYTWSNQTVPLKAIDKDSSYWLRVNTRDKFIHFHTSKNDGEPFTYDVVFDTKKGTVTLTDDAGNFALLESQENKLTVNTENEVLVNAKNNITINTENTFVTLKDNAGNSVKLDSPSGTISLKALNTIILDAPNIIEKCQAKTSSANTLSMQSSGATLSMSNGLTMKSNSILSMSNGLTMKSNSIVNDTPLVTNTGDIKTDGVSIAKNYVTW